MPVGAPRSSLSSAVLRYFGQRGGQTVQQQLDLLPVLVVDDLNLSAYPSSRRFLIYTQSAAVAAQFSYSMLFNNSEKGFAVITDLFFRPSAAQDLRISLGWDSNFGGINPAFADCTEISERTTFATAGQRRFKEVRATPSNTATDLGGADRLLNFGAGAVATYRDLGLVIPPQSGLGLSPAVVNVGLDLTAIGRFYEAS